MEFIDAKIWISKNASLCQVSQIGSHIIYLVFNTDHEPEQHSTGDYKKARVDDLTDGKARIFSHMIVLNTVSLNLILTVNVIHLLVCSFKNQHLNFKLIYSSSYLTIHAANNFDIS